MNLPNQSSPIWVVFRGAYVLCILAFMLWANYSHFDPNRDWTTIGITLLALAGFDITKISLTKNQ